MGWPLIHASASFLFYHFNFIPVSMSHHSTCTSVSSSSALSHQSREYYLSLYLHSGYHIHTSQSMSSWPEDTHIYGGYLPLRHRRSFSFLPLLRKCIAKVSVTNPTNTKCWYYPSNPSCNTFHILSPHEIYSLWFAGSWVII